MDIQNLNTDVKIMQSDLSRYTKLIDKIDTLTNNIDKMLISNNERINTHEDHIDDIKEKLSDHITSDEKSLKDLRERVEGLEKYKWVLFGAFSAVSTIVTLVLHYFK